MPPQQPPVKKYGELYTGFDIDFGVGYSGLTTKTVRSKPSSTIESHEGASGVALQARLGSTYGFYSHWIIGLDAYGQYNSAKINYNASGITVPSSTNLQRSLDLPWNLGVQARIGFVYSPSNVIFIYGGPDWANASSVYISDLLTHNQTEWLFGGRFGAGLEHMLSERWIMKGAFDYGFYDSFPAVHGDGTQTTYTPNLATLLFSVGYLF